MHVSHELLVAGTTVAIINIVSLKTGFRDAIKINEEQIRTKYTHHTVKRITQNRRKLRKRNKIYKTYKQILHIPVLPDKIKKLI